MLHVFQTRQMAYLHVKYNYHEYIYHKIIVNTILMNTINENSIIISDCPRNKCGFDCKIDCYCKEEVIGPMKIDGVCLNGCSKRWTGKNGKCDTGMLHLY